MRIERGRRKSADTIDVNSRLTFSHIDYTGLTVDAPMDTPLDTADQEKMETEMTVQNERAFALV
jgi:hypothetical protein